MIEPDAVQGFLDRLCQAGPPGAGPWAAGPPGAGQPSFAAVVEEIRRLGIAPGTPVMVAVPNGAAFVAVVLALLTREAVPVLLPPSAPPARIERMARALGADVLITPRVQGGLAREEPSHMLDGSLRLAFLHGVRPRAYRPGEIVLLTSGTSGVFSGCLHHIDSLLLNAARHAEAVGQTAADRVLINLPLHYSYAFVAQLLASFVSGSTAVVSGPPFTPAHHERTVRQHGGTVSSLTPVMVESWLRAGTRFPAGLRCLTVGGDTLGASSVAAVLAGNPGLEVYLTYGLTEAGPRVSTLAAHREPPHRHGSVGLPLPGVEVRLRKEDPRDTVGELVVETDTGMLRKVGHRAAAAPPAGGGRVSIGTGDFFEMDDEGYLFFRRRRTTYVMSRGEKVSLRSVCETAEALPGVRAAQAWVHENAAGDVVFTLDVYCADASVDGQEIRRRLARVLLRSEQPAHVVVHPVSQLGWRKSVAK
ncbi:class I adenylate-forming enzyme family protein [Streptomyces niveus]|uniref:class I adenylate-forming enzyme family protein n=1 Tax=Streptomyces niveus TaxID=193462 RepID=UPI0036D42615